MTFTEKQLKIIFPIGLICGMITAMVSLSSKDCFAMEKHPPFSYYEVIEQRNIFRPKIESVDISQEQKSELQSIPEYTESALDHYVLTGIVKIRGRYKATITNKKTEDGHYVGINDSIDNFEVIDIEHDKAILEQDNETYELKINTPPSRVQYKKPVENETSNILTPLSEKPLTPQNKIKQKRNITESIRMGIPNVQRK